MDNQTPEQRESLWRRKLSQAERAGVRGQPELELESRLTDAITRLPDAPVPSNFAARVMGAIDREEAREARSRSLIWGWNWRALLPRVAVTAALLAFVSLEFQHQHHGPTRTEMAKTLSAVASADSSVPSVEVLENLDTIQHLSQPTKADTDLLVDLQ